MVKRSATKNSGSGFVTLREMISAYLDLGTNTFELLVVEHTGPTNYRFIDRHLIPCFLGEGSYSDGKANPKSINRARLALNEMQERAHSLGAEYIIAAGTSAMRDYGLANMIEDIRMIKGKVIEGSEEARLVRMAMQEAASKLEGNILFLDIGGGSVELSATGAVNYSESMNIGVRRLKEKLNIGKELSSEDTRKIEGAIAHHLESWPQLNKVEHLVGCSGTMESLFALMNNSPKLSTKLSEVDTNEALKFLDQWISSSIEERLNENSIEDFRAEMLPIGFCLIKSLIHSYHIPKLYYSKFGLKEALFFEDLKTRYA